VLEQINAVKVGENALDPGLKKERFRLKGAALDGAPQETDEDILQEALESVSEG